MSQRIAVVTGATSGIGRATAGRIAAAGHLLVVNARDQPGLDAFSGQLKASGAEVVSVAGDDGRPETAAQLVEVCAEVFGGPPTIGVVNAGRGLPGTLLTSDATQWE